MDGETLMAVLSPCPELEQRLQQFSQALAMQATQIAACNRLHEIDERLARWLLMSADCGGSNYLVDARISGSDAGNASCSVTLAAGILQRAGLITHTRRDVKIIERKK